MLNSLQYLWYYASKMAYVIVNSQTSVRAWIFKKMCTVMGSNKAFQKLQ